MSSILSVLILLGVSQVRAGFEASVGFGKGFGNPNDGVVPGQNMGQGMGQGMQNLGGQNG
jgi:hypothetical protein